GTGRRQERPLGRTRSSRRETQHFQSRESPPIAAVPPIAPARPAAAQQTAANLNSDAAQNSTQRKKPLSQPKLEPSRRSPPTTIAYTHWDSLHPLGCVWRLAGYLGGAGLVAGGGAGRVAAGFTAGATMPDVDVPVLGAGAGAFLS